LLQSYYKKTPIKLSCKSSVAFIRIREILNVPYSEFFDFTVNSVYNQDLKDNSIGHYEVQTLYQENREVYEKLIAAKDEQIIPFTIISYIICCFIKY